MKNILQKQQMENITGGDWLCIFDCSDGSTFLFFLTTIDVLHDISGICTGEFSVLCAEIG